MYLRHWLGLYAVLVLLTGAAALSNWTALAEQYDNAFRAQRDISKAIPIDQLALFGISLNTVVFDAEGYSTDAIALVTDLLEASVDTFMLDLYWNEFTQCWQLCPAPIPSNLTTDLAQTVLVAWNGANYSCQPGFSVTDVMNAVHSYLVLSNVQVDANVVQLAFNLKSIYYTATNTTTTGVNSTVVLHDAVPSGYASPGATSPADVLYLLVGNSTLSDSLAVLGSFLYTPANLADQTALLDAYAGYYDSQYPTQNDFLFSLYKRTIALVLADNLRNSSLGYNLTSTDTNTVFFPDTDEFDPWVVVAGAVTLTEPKNYSSSYFADIAHDSHFRFAIDSDDLPFTEVSAHEFLQSGISIIINSSYENSSSENASDAALGTANTYLPSSFWSWAIDQPSDLDNTTSDSVLPRDMEFRTFIKRDDDDDESDSWYELSSQSAYLCVTIGSGGWTVLNCYDKYRFACRNTTNPFHWEVSETLDTYFVLSSSGICPNGFTFAVPQLGVEQFAVRTLLTSLNAPYPIWVDVNDITISDCYVTGGPYATCPYKEAVSTGNLLKRVAPSMLVAILIVLLLFCERILITIPIHTNRRRHWNKAIARYYKENDYEGVPS